MEGIKEDGLYLIDVEGKERLRPCPCATPASGRSLRSDACEVEWNVPHQAKERRW